MSGYGGTIFFVTGTYADPLFAADVTAWQLHYEQRMHELFVKRYVTSTLGQIPALAVGAFRWGAVVNFLFTDDLVDTSLVLGTPPAARTVDIRLCANAATIYWQGVANIVSYDLTTPLDGPITCRARLQGTSIPTIKDNV